LSSHSAAANAVVVDTDVVSYTFKGDSRRDAYRKHLNGRFLLISPQTIAELERWALTANWGVGRRSGMEQHLRRYLVQPFSRALCVKWAEAIHGAGLNSFTVHGADAWIAAVALLHDIPLVTNNGKHFRGIEGLIIISES
jgi:tRNA(fMet)-specific endonuclease VapC